MVLVAKRIARRDIFDSDNRGDIARVTRLDIFALIRLDLDQPRNAFALVRARIVDRIAFAKRAGVNTEENEFADERIAPEFKSEGAKLPVVIGWRFHRLARVGVLTFGRRNFERA